MGWRTEWKCFHVAPQQALARLRLIQPVQNLARIDASGVYTDRPEKAQRRLLSAEV
jgi:hypothetical protein